ncbi:MAG TPA: PrgI family protein [Candidatus Saccharimonadales bacterium]
MATYKVIQDIEAEDKLLGPLTLRQFIYAAIFVILGFIAFKLSTTLKTPYISIIFLPPMAFFGLLAAPFGNDQPNEIWLLAKFKFFLKPQIRKWDQDGLSGLVTVSVPKIVQKKLTKDYTYDEAKGRLESLAKVLDTNGFTVNSVIPSYNTTFLNQDVQDRLIDLSTVTLGQPTTEIVDQEDIFDESNLRAQHINEVMTISEEKIKEYHTNLVRKPPAPTISSEKAPLSNLFPSENPIDQKEYLRSGPETTGFSPIENTFGLNIPNKESEIPVTVTTQTDNAKISVLARNNNLSIASIDRELKGGDNPDEVTISLH